MFTFAQYLKYWSTEGNQTIQFGQLIEYYVKNIFLKNHAENEPVRLVSDHFCFFQKNIIWGKKSDSNLVSIYFDNLTIGHRIKLYEISHCFSRDILNYSFSGKTLRLVFQPSFMYHFPRKICLLLYSITWQKFIV